VEKSFNSEDFASDECVICKQEYIKDQKIITLTCDSK